MEYLGPILTALAGVAAIAITVLGGWGLSILERKLGIDKHDRAAAVFESAISNGISGGDGTQGAIIITYTPTGGDTLFGQVLN